jgi:hypothetical protein
MQVVYICAPLDAPTPEGIAHNIARAEALGRLVVHCGHAPIVVHSSSSALYGTDHARALESDKAIVRMIARFGGMLWILERDDGTLSPGCGVESDTWYDAGRTVQTRFTWAEWRVLAEERGFDLDTGLPIPRLSDE